MFSKLVPTKLPGNDKAPPGRLEPMAVPETHFVNGNPLEPPFPSHLEQVVFGLGCFWGAERIFWETPGVFTTAAGYAGGTTPNADYQDVCSGLTGHTEVVLVVFDPGEITFERLLKVFWEAHDPTQGMRQGNDVGTQYRSAVFTTTHEQENCLPGSLAAYQYSLTEAGFGLISTEVGRLEQFYYAEDYHQQYLAKNPAGYCGIGGTGVTCPLRPTTAES